MRKFSVQRRGLFLSLFAAYFLLLSMLPLYAASAQFSGFHVHQKNNPVTLVLSPDADPPDDTDDAWVEPHAIIRPARIRDIFPNPALSLVIAEAFGISTQNFLTQSDLNRIIAFSADGRGIENLQGMQYLRNLREVSFNDNRITSLAPLADLTSLERLLLDQNDISDLSPLSRLTRLSWLWLDHNRITSLRPLAPLTSLTWLTLWDNQVTDVSPLGAMVRLESLWLADNEIRDIAPIAPLTSLTALSIAHNQIGDLSPLYDMTALTLVWIGRQDIVLPQTLRTRPFFSPAIVFDVDGTAIAPDEITHGGTFAPNQLRWDGLTDEIFEVRYTFSHTVTVGDTSDVFYGHVVIPLSSTPFWDVSRNHWFYAPITWVFESGLMQGMSATSFFPGASVNRAMAVTVLHRFAGTHDAPDLSTFYDVSDGMWYTDAVHWAYGLGIVQGLGRPDRFAPYAHTTREQAAVMLFRHATLHGVAVTPPDDFDLSAFVDHASISPWAEEAMRFAVYAELITGTSASTPTLSPRAEMTRAAWATTLLRFSALF